VIVLSRPRIVGGLAGSCGELSGVEAREVSPGGHCEAETVRQVSMK